jgi:hypothetical protein
VIVDFTIEDNPNRAVLIADGLVAGDQVNDAQAPHSESDAAVRVNTLIVRTAMSHRGTHPAQDVLANRGLFPELHDARNSTH